MGTPSRFPNGITNNKSGPLRDLTALDPTQLHVFFDDFMETFNATPWTITTVEAGSGSATEAVGDTQFGELVITNDDADNDSDFIFWDTSTFLLGSGKKAWFKSRFKVSDATQSDFVMGLQANDATPLDTTQGVFFRSDDGDANIDFMVEKDNAGTEEAAVTTMADDTYVELAWYYNGKDAIEVWKDNVKVFTQTDLSRLPDGNTIGVSFGIQNGEAAAKVMTVDYIYVAVER